MNRRKLLAHGAGSVTVVSISGLSGLPAITFAQPAGSMDPRAASMESWRQRVQAILNKGRVPIIDMQATYVSGTTKVERMMKWMDELDVAQIAFAAAFAPDSEPSLELHRQHPGYFIPTTSSGEFPRWWNNPLAFLNGVSNDLQTGNYFTMGEHEFRHYPSPEQVAANNTARDITIALDGPAGQRLFRLSEETGMAFQIHYEIEDRLLPTLEDMLARHPKALVIWCHLGMIRYPDRAKNYGPDYVASLIERFPGLHFDLAVPPPENVYRPSGAHDSTIYSADRLADKWLALLEKFPDRFIAASDYRPPVEHYYPATIERQRKLILEPLGNAARHKIAYANAWRLVTGKPWSN